MRPATCYGNTFSHSSHTLATLFIFHFSFCACVCVTVFALVYLLNPILMAGAPLGRSAGVWPIPMRLFHYLHAHTHIYIYPFDLCHKLS